VSHGQAEEGPVETKEGWADPRPDTTPSPRLDLSLQVCQCVRSTVHQINVSSLCTQRFSIGYASTRYLDPITCVNGSGRLVANLAAGGISENQTIKDTQSSLDNRRGGCLFCLGVWTGMKGSAALALPRTLSVAVSREWNVEPKSASENDIKFKAYC
jgi:hypothetical protein